MGNSIFMVLGAGIPSLQVFDLRLVGLASSLGSVQTYEPSWVQSKPKYHYKT